MIHKLRIAVVSALLAGAGGCVEFSVGAAGVPFVVQGTATVIEFRGPCAVWVGDNGLTYHLFQSRFLDNELFDRVTTPGTTSRLVIATRTDLEVSCQTGTIVEVQDVLEILD